MAAVAMAAMAPSANFKTIIKLPLGELFWQCYGLVWRYSVTSRHVKLDVCNHVTYAFSFFPVLK